MIGRKNVDPEDEKYGDHLAAQQTTAPLSDFMIRLMAEELPMLDSVDRTRVYRILDNHKEQGKPVIKSQEELPKEIRQIMDL